MADQTTFSEISELPDEPEAWDELALKLGGQGRWEEAAHALGNAAQANPHYAWRWLAISQCWRRAGKNDEAIAALLQARELIEKTDKSTFPDLPWSPKEELSVYRELAQLYGRTSRWAECEQACLAALERDPYDLQLMEMMAGACLQMEHLSAAEELLDTMLCRVPLSPWYRMQYIFLLEMQRRWGEAQRQLLLLLKMQIPRKIQEEAEEKIDEINQMQMQHLSILLQEKPELATALARDPRHELQKMGFHLTDAALETFQNLLWHHFDKSPYLALREKPRAQIH